MLKQILTHARERAANADGHVSELRRRSDARGPARSLSGALARPGLRLIAEIKRKSPSAGVIDGSLDPRHQATAYVDGGADAISVLTEPMYFGGSMSDLAAVRGVVDVPVLRKDFTMAPSQVWEARAGGADAVLLIVAALEQTVLENLISVACAAGAEAIVEAHSPDEVVRAIDAGATIIGVNNRDLTTFTTDLAVAESIAPLLGAVEVTIAESGVSTSEGAKRMARAGYDAILVGEALVRSPHPAQLVRELKGSA